MADLCEITIPPNEKVIEYLEDLTERAKTGEVQGFAIAIMKSAATTANGWVGLGTNCITMVGEIEAMKVDLIRANVDQRYDCEGHIKGQ